MGCQRSIVHRYVAREALRPCALALLGLTSVVLTKELLGLADLVVNRGVGVSDVATLALFQALPVASAVLPLAALIGVLGALGRLGADREILALEVCGVAPRRLVGPAITFAAGMAMISLFLSLAAAPWASRSLDRRLDALVRAQPLAALRAGAVQHFGDWRLEAREVSARGDALRGVLLFAPELGETLFAREGSLKAGPRGSGELLLTLHDARVLLPSRGGARALRFERLTSRLSSAPTPARSRSERLPGLSLSELRDLAGAFTPSEGAPLPRAAIELQRRFATPAATFAMGLLGAPLFFARLVGVGRAGHAGRADRRRLSRSSGSVLGVLAAVAYFGLVQLGEGLLQSGLVGVAAGVWLPPAVLASLALLLVALLPRRESVRDERSPAHGRGRSGVDGASAASLEPRRFALSRYVAGRFVGLALLAFSALLAGYLLVDVLERLDWFARYRATGAEVVRFYAVRLPLLAARVVPMALLVGTALTASLLAAEGELVGLRACGIPAARALAPLLGVCALAVPLHFALTDALLPRTNAMADRLKQTEIKERYYRELAERRKVGVWKRVGGRLLQAARFDAERGEARELTLYEIGESGLPRSRSDALAARHVGGGVWRLVEPRRVELVEGRAREVAAQPYVELGRALPAEVDTMHLSVASLAREIARVEADGYDATRLRVDLHWKLARPLACLVLPAAALLHAVGGPPFPAPARMLLVSGALGVGYLLLVGVCASLGHGGALPPSVAGWSPLLFAAACIAALALRARGDRGKPERTPARRWGARASPGRVD